jgi:uncharacterized protein involved in exopolysaccharide biosynthesis
MDSSVHSIIAAQIVQDRMAEATSARAERAARATRSLDPKTRSSRRWLRRFTRTLAPAPPR